jgi:hypothetical protein
VGLRPIAVVAAGVALVGVGCGDDQQPREPRRYTTDIDNPYWPMKPGGRWVYRESEGSSVKKVVVTVTGETKRLANGVTARVVRDEVTENAKPVELTDDFYAQDQDGNVWYMGEETAEYEDGKVTTRAGSFEAGRDGAKPGIIMPAHPRPGMDYRQEYLKGEAEDKARVLSVDDQAEVPAGHFRHALLTRDVNPLEPKVLEYKLYARGVGPVLVLSASGGSGREELISFRRG